MVFRMAPLRVVNMAYTGLPSARSTELNPMLNI